MRWHHGVLALAFWTALATGCTDDFPGDQGPFASLPLKRTLGAPGLTADVHIARDRFGIAHIYAQDVGDLGYAQGYVMAHDRLPQMDLLRRFGAGTLSDIFGAVVTDIISGDLKMRMHRMRPIAVEAYAELLRSDDPSDVKIVRLLDRFADGVNAYADDLRNRVYTLDFAISSIRPQDFEPWSPIDSLVLGRFQSFSLSFDAPTEIVVTDIYEAAAAVFDGASSTPAFAARAGAAADFIPLRPVGLVPTIDGFPNLGVDSGSRSNGKARRAMRPRIPPELLRSALATFASGGRPDPQRLGRPLAGSNAWAVGATLAGGKGLLAGDQHLDLSSPSVFYPTHLIVPGEVDVVAWAGSLTATQLGRLHDAGDRLAAWTLDAAAGVEGSPGSLEIANSVATSIFNVWLVHFLDLAIGDELVAMQRQRSDLRKAMTARLAEMLLIEPESLVSGLSPQTGEPILCDSLDTTSIIESCTLIVLQALHAALTWLEGPDAFDTDDMQAWRWGALHTLTFNALDGTKALRLPAPDEPDPARQNGFPRPGDNFAINRGDSGLDDLDFRHEGHGAAQRFLAEADGGLMRSWMSLPGGVIFDRDSPHYRDLLDDYYLNHTTFEVPFQIPSIIANGEERWVIEK